MGDDLETKEPAGGEKKATPPSSVSEGIRQFEKKQSEAAKAAATATAGASPDKDKETQLSKEGDKKGGDPAYQDVRIVDKDGNEVPYRMTVDGELVEVTDPKKLGQYARLGYHSDKTGKSLNERELTISEREKKFQEEVDAFGQGQETIGIIDKALKDGRLVISDPASKVKEETPEIDEELYSDPAALELKRENIEIKKTVKDITEQLKVTNQMLLGKLVEEQHGKIEADMARLKPTYGLADENKVWDLLALTKKDGKTPLHTVEEAMKKSQEEEKVKFDKYRKSDPDFAKLSTEETEKVIKKYLEDKAEREKAPVSSPSGSTVVVSKDDKTKEDRKNWRMKDWAAAGSKMLGERIAAAKKS